MIGAIQRRLGKWADSADQSEKAVSLDPNHSWPLQNLVFNYQMLRDFDGANKTIDRGLKVNPGGLGLWEIKSKLAVAEKGDLSVSEQAFQAVKSMPMTNEEKLRIAGAQRTFSFRTQIPGRITRSGKPVRSCSGRDSRSFVPSIIWFCSKGAARRSRRAGGPPQGKRTSRSTTETESRFAGPSYPVRKFWLISEKDPALKVQGASRCRNTSGE